MPPAWTSGIARPAPALATRLAVTGAAEGETDEHHASNVTDVSRATDSERTPIQALVSLVGAAGIALLVPVGILAVGIPVALTVRALLEVAGVVCCDDSLTDPRSDVGAMSGHTMTRTVKSHPRRDKPPDPPRLHLAELLDFRPDQGIIRLHEQRVVILSAAAMGLLRKELVDTLGLETARRLLLRFGFADGYHDAVNLRERSEWASPVGRASRRRDASYARRHRSRRRLGSNTTKRPGASRRKWTGTTRTWPSSTCITTARALHRSAGLWSGIPAGSSARAWQGDLFP